MKICNAVFVSISIATIFTYLHAKIDSSKATNNWQIVVAVGTHIAAD